MAAYLTTFPTRKTPSHQKPNGMSARRQHRGPNRIATAQGDAYSRLEPLSNTVTALDTWCPMSNEQHKVDEEKAEAEVPGPEQDSKEGVRPPDDKDIAGHGFRMGVRPDDDENVGPDKRYSGY